MGFTVLHILWLVPAFTLTTQELVGLSVSPSITAECDAQVTLHCKVSSSLNGLSIKHMEWSRSRSSLCSVNSEGRVTYNGSKNDFHCEYKEGWLSLIYPKVQPLESGNSTPYRCKLQSNKGAVHEYTTVELQDCGKIVEAVLTSQGPTCTFNHVYPDADVHWFHGSHNLSDGSVKHDTTKRVDDRGWLTIHSYLQQRSSGVPYNCSLKSSRSGRYIASTLVEKTEAVVGSSAIKVGSSHSKSNGVGAKGPVRTVLCISFLFAVMLK